MDTSLKKKKKDEHKNPKQMRKHPKKKAHTHKIQAFTPK